MNESILALAAGAVGSVVTLGATAGVRFFAARSEIETNDRRVAELDRDLERWVTDDHVRLKRELRDLRNDLSGRNLFYSGEYGYRLGLAKERALQVYRDHEDRATREWAAIRASEGLMHLIWRWIARRKRTTLSVPIRVKPVLDTWLLPPSKHLQPGDTPPQVPDPFTRNLDDVLAEIAENTADFV